jgi:tRNA dimethylallyltransferase
VSQDAQASHGRTICVVGPTGSGKSEVADRVAERLGGAVISVDAMQVYRGMDIGTAKTPPSSRRAPLLMVDVCDPGEGYSAQRFQHDARQVIDDLTCRGIVPVLCGGTGLYLDATIDELSLPEGSGGDARRKALERRAEVEGAQVLHDELEARDPRSAALIHPHNVRRTIRAIELLDDGTSYAASYGSSRSHEPHYDARIWGLATDRQRLYDRIDARVDGMMASGLLDEVRTLGAHGLDRAPTASQAIGYKELLEYLAGACTLDEAVTRVKRRSRRYAKRQLTWLRHDDRVRWIDMDVTDVGHAAETIVSDWKVG